MMRLLKGRGERMRMRWDILKSALLFALGASVSGCLIDDSGSVGERPAGPTATVPDAGGPARRESAAKTLNDAEPERPAGDDGATLEVEPNPSRIPPPPVQ